MPRALDDALAALARHPGALPLAGGTDVLVDINFGRSRPDVVLDLSRVEELKRVVRGAAVEVGAGVPFTRLIQEFGDEALGQASRTIGSPQIRNRATIGGNLGTASPAGDSLPVLSAYEADVVVHSGERGERSVPFAQFMLAPRRTTLGADELITAVRWTPVRGPSSFHKIGTRNAMVIAVANLCLAIDTERNRVRIALGSVGPTIIRATEAERIAEEAITGGRIAPDAFGEIADAVAAATRPIDDVRGTARYRRHCCRVLATRALRGAFPDGAASGAA